MNIIENNTCGAGFVGGGQFWAEDSVVEASCFGYSC